MSSCGTRLFAASSTRCAAWVTAGASGGGVTMAERFWACATELSSSAGKKTPSKREHFMSVSFLIVIYRAPQDRYQSRARPTKGFSRRSCPNVDIAPCPGTKRTSSPSGNSLPRMAASSAA